MTEEWGPWIDHDGKGCPCVGEWVQVMSGACSCRHVAELIAVEGEEWGCGFLVDCRKCGAVGVVSTVIRYRIRKPRALSMLEKIARDVKIPVDA